MNLRYSQNEMFMSGNEPDCYCFATGSTYIIMLYTCSKPKALQQSVPFWHDVENNGSGFTSLTVCV